MSSEILRIVIQMRDRKDDAGVGHRIRPSIHSPAICSMAMRPERSPDCAAANGVVVVSGPGMAVAGAG